MERISTDFRKKKTDHCSSSKELRKNKTKRLPRISDRLDRSFRIDIITDLIIKKIFYWKANICNFHECCKYKDSCDYIHLNGEFNPLMPIIFEGICLSKKCKNISDPDHSMVYCWFLHPGYNPTKEDIIEKLMTLTHIQIHNIITYKDIIDEISETTKYTTTRTWNSILREQQKSLIRSSPIPEEVFETVPARLHLSPKLIAFGDNKEPTVPVFDLNSQNKYNLFTTKPTSNNPPHFGDGHSAFASGGRSEQYVGWAPPNVSRSSSHPINFNSISTRVPQTKGKMWRIHESMETAASTNSRIDELTKEKKELKQENEKLKPEIEKLKQEIQTLRQMMFRNSSESRLYTNDSSQTNDSSPDIFGSTCIKDLWKIPYHTPPEISQTKKSTFHRMF